MTDQPATYEAFPDYREQLLNPGEYAAIKGSLIPNAKGLLPTVMLAGTMYGDARRRLAKELSESTRNSAIDPDVKEWQAEDAINEVDALNNSQVVVFLLNGDIHNETEIDPTREREGQIPNDLGAASLVELSLAIRMVPFRGQKLIIYISPNFVSRLRDPLLKSMYLQIMDELGKLLTKPPYNKLVELYDGSSGKDITEVASAIESALIDQSDADVDRADPEIDRTLTDKTPAAVSRAEFSRKKAERERELLSKGGKVVVIAAGSGGPALESYREKFEKADKSSDNIFNAGDFDYIDTNDINDEIWDQYYSKLAGIDYEADNVEEVLEQVRQLLRAEDYVQDDADLFISRISRYSLSLNAVVRNNLMINRAIDQGKPMVTLVEPFDPLAYIKDYVIEKLGGTAPTNINDAQLSMLMAEFGLIGAGDYERFRNLIQDLLKEGSSVSFKSLARNSYQVPGLTECRLFKRADSVARARSTHIAQLASLKEEFPELIYVATDETDYLKKLEQYKTLYRAIDEIKSGKIVGTVRESVNKIMPGFSYDEATGLQIPAFTNGITERLARGIDRTVEITKLEIANNIKNILAIDSELLSSANKSQLILMLDMQLLTMLEAIKHSAKILMSSLAKEDPRGAFLGRLIELLGYGYSVGSTAYRGFGSLREAYIGILSQISQVTATHEIKENELLVPTDYRFVGTSVESAIRMLGSKSYPGYENAVVLSEEEFEDWYEGRGEFAGKPKNLALLAQKYPQCVILDHSHIRAERKYNLDQYINEWEEMPEQQLPKELLKALWTTRGLLIGNGWYWHPLGNPIVDLFIPIVRTEEGGTQYLYTLVIIRSDKGMEGTIATIGGMNESLAQRMGIIELLEETGMTMRQILELLAAGSPEELNKLEYEIDYAPSDLTFPDWIGIIQELKNSDDPNDIVLVSEIRRQLEIILHKFSEKMLAFPCGQSPIADVRMTGTSYPVGEMLLQMPVDPAFANSFPRIDWATLAGQAGETAGVQLRRVDRSLIEEMWNGKIPGQAIQLQRAIWQFMQLTGCAIDTNGQLGKVA